MKFNRRSFTATLVDTVEAFEASVAELGKHEVWSFDTETTGLDVLKDELVGVNYAYFDGAVYRAYYVPVAHRSGRNVPLDAVLAALKPLLASEKSIKVCHNAQYDLSILSRYGVTVRNCDDTMLMAFVLQGLTRRINMDDLAWQHFRYKTISFGDVVIKHLGMQNFSYVRTDHATAYAGEDAAVTLAFWYKFQRDLANTGALLDVYNGIDRDLPDVLSKMQMRGVHIDLTKIEALDAKADNRLQELEAELVAEHGKVLLSSPKQVAELLFDKLGLEPLELTDTGKPSTSDDALEPYAESNDTVRRIVEWRGLSKLRSSYTQAIPGHTTTNGTLHPQTSITKTRTSRFAVSKPPLQQIPKNSPVGGLIRDAFGVPAGLKLLRADYSQIEVRVLAHVSGDPTLIKALHDGLDMHTFTASLMTGKPMEEVTKTERQEAKAVTFGIMYGKTMVGLAKQLNITQRDAQHLMDTYFEKMPGVRAYINTCHTFCGQHGYVETWTGRRLYIDRDFYGWERQSQNYPIQGGAADLMRLALVKTERAFEQQCPEAELILTVHDELLARVPEERATEALALLKHAMETAADDLVAWRVPIVCEAEIRDTWME